MYSADCLFSDRHILVVGDVILDGYASGDVERISPEAPVPILRHLNHQEVAGGAANVAVNIVALGGSACLVGVVGTDDEARRLADILNASRVESRLVAGDGRPTTSKLRILASHHQMLRIDKEETGEISSDLEDMVIERALAEMPRADALVFSDYRKGCLTPRVLQAIMEGARKEGTPILVDPKRKDFSVYKGATYITPNRSEIAAATGISCEDEDTCRQAAGIVMAQTGASVLLTRSERGMALFGIAGEEFWLPTEAKEVFDVSGAGDSVIATFAYAVADAIPVAQALRIANTAAGIVIGKAGTATTSQAEILAAMERGHAHPESGERVLDLAQAASVRATWKREKLVVGFTNGCFDLIHPGHVALLREAAKQCDRLIVALNTDSSVRRLKGPSRPIQDERARAEVMAAIRHVDLVITFDEDTPLEVIQLLQPDVLIKGSDYEEHEIVGADVVRVAGGTVVRVDLRAGHSTTNLVARSNLTDATVQ